MSVWYCYELNIWNSSMAPYTMSSVKCGPFCSRSLCYHTTQHRATLPESTMNQIGHISVLLLPHIMILVTRDFFKKHNWDGEEGINQFNSLRRIVNGRIEMPSKCRDIVTIANEIWNVILPDTKTDQIQTSACWPMLFDFKLYYWYVEHDSQNTDVHMIKRRYMNIWDVLNWYVHVYVFLLSFVGFVFVFVFCRFRSLTSHIATLLQTTLYWSMPLSPCVSRGNPTNS